MTRLDSAVRQAIREDPTALYRLLADAEASEQITAALDRNKVARPWTHFIARIRDLTRNNAANREDQWPL
jgi:hypothetical protein